MRRLIFEANQKIWICCLCALLSPTWARGLWLFNLFTVASKFLIHSGHPNVDTDKSIRIKNKRGENGRLGCVFVCVCHPPKMTGGKQGEEEAKRSSFVYNVQWTVCTGAGYSESWGVFFEQNGKSDRKGEFCLPIAICAYLLEGFWMKLHKNPFFSWIHSTVQ